MAQKGPEGRHFDRLHDDESKRAQTKHELWIVTAISLTPVTMLAAPAVLTALVQKAADGTGLAVEVRRSGAPYPLGEAWEQTLLRVAQEALHNALKHAQARSFEVGLDYKDDKRFRLYLRDDGKGFEAGSWGTEPTLPNAGRGTAPVEPAWGGHLPPRCGCRSGCGFCGACGPWGDGFAGAEPLSGGGRAPWGVKRAR